MLRILFLGDVFGEPGRRAVADLLPELKQRMAADFVIINEVVNITHEDIFSEDGIIHIIDHLITL